MRKIFTLTTMLLALGAQAQVIVDEYNTYDEDNHDLYRYVVSYNANKERASETVYRKHKEYDGTWSKEERIDRGIYSYEYDSKGRMTRKEVKYENEEYLDSYYVEITYGPNETIYKQYEDDRLCKMWGTFPTGEQSLATMSEYDDRPDFYARYNKAGFITERGRYDKYEDEYTPFAIYDESGLEMKKRSNSRNKYYRYNADGKVVEYIELDYDDFRQLVTYDNLGRILKIETYELSDDNEWAEPVDPLPDNHAAPHREYQKPLDEDISNLDWVLEEVTEYTYANDEVYDVTSGWYNEFGFCGPVTTMSNKEYEDGELEEAVSITFTRNAAGKITSVDYNVVGSDLKPEFTIDSNGHITGTKMREEYDYEEPIWTPDGEFTGEFRNVHGFYEQLVEYTWSGDNLMKVVETSSYFNSDIPNKTESRTETRTYAYGTNLVTCTDTDNYGYSNIYSIDTSDGRIKQVYKDSWGDEKYFIIDKQKENVKFQLRRPFTETPALGLDSIKVISQAGRVLHVGGTEYSEEDCINAANFVQGYPFRSNCSVKDYFHVKKDNGQFYCYDYKDRITYIVKGNLLMKEYDYDVEELVSREDNYIGGGGTRAQALSTTPTEACYIREYQYDANGNLIAVIASERDKDGKITQDYKLTYTYDPESVGIQSISTNRGFRLNGRNLGANDGVTFSLYDLNGRPVATSVNDFTFDVPGTYIMKTGNKAVKINVK